MSILIEGSSWRFLAFSLKVFLGSSSWSDVRSRDRGCRMWTHCKAFSGTSLICDFGLYKINWIKCNWRTMWCSPECTSVWTAWWKIGPVFTFSSSGLWTGDADPARSESTPPLTHTSLITWTTQENTALVPETTVYNRHSEGVQIRTLLRRTGPVPTGIRTHGWIPSLKLLKYFLTSLPHN